MAAAQLIKKVVFLCRFCVMSCNLYFQEMAQYNFFFVPNTDSDTETLSISQYK